MHRGHRPTCRPSCVPCCCIVPCLLPTIRAPCYRIIGCTRGVHHYRMQVVDYNFLATVIAAFGRYMPDYKRAMGDAAGPDAKKAH